MRDDDRVAAMDIDTIATLAGMLAGFVSLATYLRHDTHRQIDQVREEFAELRGEFADFRKEVKTDLQRQDDKLFTLATGLRPLIEQAQRAQPG